MNTVETLDLWPNDIRADVVAPVAILRAQEAALRRKTQAILRAEVRSFEVKPEGDETGGKFVHKLELVAPSLGDYRVTLLTAIHETSMVYPALVKSRVFDSGNRPQISVPIKPSLGSLISMTGSKFFLEMLNQKDGPDPEFRVAESQEEFIKLVREVLQSGWVRSLIESLIARSNVVSQELNGHSEKASGDPSEPVKE